MDEKFEKEMINLANKARLLTIKMFRESGLGGHVGGSLSSAEILTVLYNGILKVDPNNPKWKLRDHFVLSKGHISGMFSSVLCLRGFFEEKFLKTYDKLESAFGMHTTTHIPGCEFSAGSLGHGLGFSVGLALGKKINQLDSRVFTLMGDGELDEGSVWEAALSANKFKLDNLIAITDRNEMNMEGPTEEIMPLDFLGNKWKSFGWSVRTVDGHSINSLYEVLKSVPFESGKPSFIIAKTIKGKGLSCFEGDYKCHYVSQDDQKWSENYKELSKFMSE